MLYPDLTTQTKSAFLPFEARLGERNWSDLLTRTVDGLYST